MSEAQIVNIKTAESKNIISPEEKELSIFLYTIFQFYLEKAIELMNSNDAVKKEKAVKILNSLLENPFINHFKSNRVLFSCINGILNFYIGLVQFNEEDQSGCETPFLKALDFFNTLPTGVKIRYINIYQEIYNDLGIVFYNKGEIKKGLQYLGKAEQIYKVFNDLNGYNITNSFPRFMLSCSRSEMSNNGNMSITNNTNNSNNSNNTNNTNNTLNNNNNPPNQENVSFTSNTSTTDLEFFNFYIDGGLNKKGFEHNYTLTIFYYAQAYTKLGFRKKAIKYCSLTLKRQIEQNEYDLKDTIVNCINLSDFYMENQHYAQCEYILISAMSLLPEGKKKKLRASLEMQLGKYFLERIKFAVKQTKEQLWISENEELALIVNRRIFNFTTLNIVWPKVEDIRDIEHAKLLFRLANTQFKKSLEYFLLDGWVSEHIAISKDISQLYKYLMFFETDNNRMFAMLDRRITILEGVMNQINPNAFIIQWQVCDYF